MSTGGVAPVLTALGGELDLPSVGHGRFDSIDQRGGAVVKSGHADAERLGVVQPTSDVVDGAERQVQTEPRADGVGVREIDPPSRCQLPRGPLQTKLQTCDSTPASTMMLLLLSTRSLSA
jgi:hypothetical protein